MIWSIVGFGDGGSGSAIDFGFRNWLDERPLRIVGSVEERIGEGGVVSEFVELRTLGLMERGERGGRRITGSSTSSRMLDSLPGVPSLMPCGGLGSGGCGCKPGWRFSKDERCFLAPSLCRLEREVEEEPSR